MLPLVADVRLFRVFDFDLNIRRRTFDDDDEVYKPLPLSFDRPFEFSISFLFVLEVVIDVANSLKLKRQLPDCLNLLNLRSILNFEKWIFSN